MKNSMPVLMLIFTISCSCVNQEPKSASLHTDNEPVEIKKEILKDKIKGAWAGQVIGCTYGGPTEFKFKGTMIPDDHFIPWYDGVFEWWYENAPGLYDDIYMDLTFVEVFQKEGLNAPVSSFANAFANADYWLWHANQAARYNILNGVGPPLSGHWKYNPHADDIDFQIEADFAGIMSPGMVNTASAICDSIGHIMNYGDGWYGGVYVAAMYSLAFISDDIDFIVSEGLRTIPPESSFHQLISDVINWHKTYPDDWKMNWFLTQKKWASEVGCPDGVFADFNIDAKINAAYIVIGLLYGQGDFEQTVRISTLCGQDSDCNPASAAGILGTMIGYESIPDDWKNGLSSVEEINFKYTDISLSKAYQYSYDQALQVIEKFGGKVDNEIVTVSFQSPRPVRYEKGFKDHFPAEFKTMNLRLDPDQPSFKFEFSGNGFVVGGGCPWGTAPSYSGIIEVYIDNILHEKATIPADYRTRRHELTWAYELDPGKHVVEIKLVNPEKGKEITVNKIIVYAPSEENRSKPGIIVN